MTVVVGRAAELAQVDHALAEARAGRGRLLLVTGPAGIGKTLLADHAVEAAQRAGMRVATGYAVDDPGAPPLWPWLRALRDWPGADGLPSPEAGEPDAAARFRLFVAITELVRERAEPDGLLVVLDDMHWADRTSLLLVRHLLAELPRSRVAVVVTGRDGVPGAFAEAEPHLVRGDAAVAVGLTGLGTDEISAWLPHLADTAAALRRATHGNPLLVRLVAEQLADRALPAGGDPLARLMSERPQLRRLVAAKVEPLGPRARALVEAAAVLGERVVPDVLAAMLALSEPQVDAALDEAATAGLLREDVGGSGGLQLEHALVRDAVYAALAATRRAQLHRAAATALELLRPEGAAGSIAHHWQRAGGPEAAAACVRWAQRADDDARTVLAFDDAAGFARLAVTAARDAGADDAERARLLVRLAEAQFLADRVPESIRTCEEAARLAEVAGRGDLAAQAALVVHGMGDPYANRVIPRLGERALALVDPEDHATRARLQAQLAVGAAETEEGPRPAALAAAALAEAERSGDPDAILEAIAARHLTISVPHTVHERLELGRRAVELGAAARQPVAAMWGHLWRLDAAYQLGDMSAVEGGLAAVDRVAREHRSVLARWHHLRYRAVRESLVGDFAAARGTNDAARDLAVRIGDLSMIGMDQAFRIQLMRLRGVYDDEPSGWRELLRQAPPLPLVQVARPILHALAGDLETARAEFEEFRHVPASYPVGVRWAGTVGQVAAAAVLLDDAEVCATAYELFLPLAGGYSGDGSGGVFGEGAVDRLLGDYALVAGRPDRALGHYRRAIDSNARIGARPFTALSRLGVARSVLALGGGAATAGADGESVPALLAQAAGEFRRLDMPGPLATAERLLRRVPAAPGPLTPRETEVAELVAAGLTNRAVADRLYLSERTVETHVRHVLIKLGLSNRAEVVAWVLRR